MQWPFSTIATTILLASFLKPYLDTITSSVVRLLKIQGVSFFIQICILIRKINFQEVNNRLIYLSLFPKTVALAYPSDT